MAILYKRFDLRRTVFLLAFFWLTGAIQAQAASNLFTIENVKVDVTADNAIAARDQAFAKAQREAFTVLAQRMLSESEMDGFTLPDSSVISTLIQDYEITEEKLSSVRYIGTYIFRFKDKAVRRHFSGSGVEYTDVSSRPVLVLPFYQYKGRTTLWSPYNAWMAAWNRAPEFRGLVPIAVPLGDLDDVKDIGEDQALTYNEQGLARLLSRYRAGEAVLAIAVPDGNLSLVESDHQPATGSMSINIYRTDRAGPEYVQQIVVSASSGQSKAQMFDRAVQKVHKTLQKDWKQKTVVSAQQGNKLQVRVRFEGLEEWAATQRALERVYGINEIILKSLSPKEARLDLLFQGDESRLRLALQQADMTLTQPRITAAAFNQGMGYSAMPLVYDLYLNRYGRQSGAYEGRL